MTNQTIRKRIKEAIEGRDTQNRSEIGVNCVKLRGIERTKDGVIVNKVTVSLENPLSVHLYDAVTAINDLESEGIQVVNKYFEC